MKKGFLIAVALFLLVSGAWAQIERGDSEISFMGYYNTLVGEDVEVNGSGVFQLSYGKYITSRLQIGIAPNLRFYLADDEEGEKKIETDWSGSIFFNYNFSTASKFIPYITGQYYQFTFDIPEGGEFTDYSYVNVGIGFKNFFNEYAAFNTLVSYGFSLAQETENKVGLLSIMTGLTFIF